MRLRLAVLACRTDNVVGRRGHDITHVLLSYVVDLCILLDLWRGQPRAFTSNSFFMHSAYLSVVGVDRAIAVDG